MCAQWSMKPSNKLGAKQKIWSSPFVWGALFVGKDATFPNHCHVSPFSATSLLRPRGWCWWCRFSNPLCPVLLFFFRWPLNSCCINWFEFMIRSSLLISNIFTLEKMVSSLSKNDFLGVLREFLDFVTMLENRCGHGYQEAYANGIRNICHYTFSIISFFQIFFISHFFTKNVFLYYFLYWIFSSF